MVCVGGARTQLLLFGGFASSGAWLNDVHVLDTSCRQTFLPVNPFAGTMHPEASRAHWNECDCRVSGDAWIYEC